jgi:hypothetical protein
MKLVTLIEMFLNETCNEVLISKHKSDTFPIHNGLNEGDALASLLFKSALESAIRKVEENQIGMKITGRHQLLVYADDANLLGNNIDSIKKKQKL